MTTQLSHTYNRPEISCMQFKPDHIYHSTGVIDIALFNSFQKCLELNKIKKILQDGNYVFTNNYYMAYAKLKGNKLECIHVPL